MAILDLATCPRELIEDAAAGVDDILTVAANYGLTYQEYITITAQPWFISAVSATKQHLESQGFTFFVQARTMLQVLTGRMFSAAMSEKDLTKVAQAVRTLNEIVKPKEAEAAEKPEAGFVLNMYFGDAGHTPALGLPNGTTQTIDGSYTDSGARDDFPFITIPDEHNHVDPDARVENQDMLPPAPEHFDTSMGFTLPDFGRWAPATDLSAGIGNLAEHGLSAVPA
jgi:hypothetical protein